MNQRYDLIVVGSGARGLRSGLQEISAGSCVLIQVVRGTLPRFAPRGFEADAAHQCLPWPFGDEHLAPSCDEAERLLAVTRLDDEPELQALIGKITASGAWRGDRLPLGLDPRLLGNEHEAKHFDGYASPGGFKSDAERCLLDRIADAPAFSLRKGRRVSHLLPSPGDASVIAGVRCEDGSSYHADAVVLAAGAMTAPRILQDHFDDFPHSTVQCLGWIDGEILGTRARRRCRSSCCAKRAVVPSASSPPPRTACTPRIASSAAPAPEPR